MKSTSQRNVIIAGGGTGGHIYPGVAIARTLEKKYPEFQVHFVGAKGGLEEKIVPRENFELHTISIGKLHRSVGIVAQLKTLLQLPLSFLAAYRILKMLSPTVVLGVGGFASGPLLFVAALFGYRSLIWEPNAYPGLANRWLARLVDECLVVFDDARRFLHGKKVSLVGLPVRSSMRPSQRTKGGPLRVLIFGGSQGARAINEVVCASVERGGSWLSGVELVHQTGSLDFERIRARVPASATQVKVLEYLHDMNDRYAWADLVVCRSGASTVAEICACEKAAVFIPLPTAADNHQQKNAEVLARAGAAEMILQKDLSVESFTKMIERFRDQRNLVYELESRVKSFSFANADETIVEHLMQGIQR